MGPLIGFLGAVLLVLFGLCVVVTAAAWLPDWAPPATRVGIRRRPFTRRVAYSWLSGSCPMLAKSVTANKPSGAACLRLGYRNRRGGGGK
jgi:hypothetical protein